MVIMIVGDGSGDDDFAGAKRMSDDDGDCCIGVDSSSVVEVKEMVMCYWSTRLLILGMRAVDFGWW